MPPRMSLNVVQHREGQREFLVHHGYLESLPYETHDGRENLPRFIDDLVIKERLDPFRGEFVAYQQGVLCGHSKSGDTLFKEAVGYYGASGLAVFLVPREGSEVDLQQARGRISLDAGLFAHSLRT